ncbi:hypothetical protein PV325_002327 [Microctonus aethiopoides]|nr:hypothetical protein PV325_002327 [Microctonus aethiopoides]
MDEVRRKREREKENERRRVNVWRQERKRETTTVTRRDVDDDDGDDNRRERNDIHATRRLGMPFRNSRLISALLVTAPVDKLGRLGWPPEYSCQDRDARRGVAALPSPAFAWSGDFWTGLGLGTLK